MKKINKKRNEDIYVECLEFMCEQYALQIKTMQKNIYWLLLYLERNLKLDFVKNERDDINEK